MIVLKGTVRKLDNHSEIEIDVFIRVVNLNELIHADGDDVVFVTTSDGQQWGECKKNIIFEGWDNE